MNQKNKSKNNAKAGLKTAKNKNMGLPALLPAYPGQVVKQFTCEGTPVVLPTTVTTGVIAAAIATQASTISNFATRFGALFEEYRIVRVKWSVRCFSSSNVGLAVHWVDEKQNGVPTAAEAQQKSDKSFPLSSPSPRTIIWTARDPLDLQFIDIGTINTNVCTYKLYTDAATFGAPIVATNVAQLTSKFVVQFRGYN